MSMLYLWHPAVSADGTVLDMILTRGDSDQVGGGADRFVGATLRTLDIPVPAEKWSIRPFRCNFYSEYWTQGDWKSQWDFVWRMTLHFKRPVTVEPLQQGYLGIDDIDDYSPLVESYKYEPFACLVVAAFPSQQQAEAAAGRIAEDRDLREARQIAAAPDPATEVLRVGGDFHLRGVLGGGDDNFFKGDYPKMVVSLLEKSGGVIHAES